MRDQKNRSPCLALLAEQGDLRYGHLERSYGFWFFTRKMSPFFMFIILGKSYTEHNL